MGLYHSMVVKFNFLFLILEERGREGEKHQCERETSDWLPLACTPTRDQTCNSGMCSGTRTQDLSICRTMPNQLVFWEKIVVVTAQYCECTLKTFK